MSRPVCPGPRTSFHNTRRERGSDEVGGSNTLTERDLRHPGVDRVEGGGAAGPRLRRRRGPHDSEGQSDPGRGDPPLERVRKS